MSQAENLLASLNENVSEHVHSVVDSDTYFIIDPVTRKIENTAYRKNTIMQYDHNSERFTFELARYVEGHDMSLCNRVRVHYINVGVDEETQEAVSNADLAELDDLRVNPDNPETVICSWLISRQATQIAGNLSFLVQYMCVSDMGVVDYEWHSGIYNDIDVDAGRNNGEAAVIEYTDLIEQWRAKLFDSGDSVISEITLNAETQLNNIRTEGAKQVAAVTAEGEAQVAAVINTGAEEIAAIELKGLQTLESIPEDYTETNNLADEAVRTKSNAIVCEAAGESIMVNNSSNDYVRGLKVFGKSTQVTTTGVQLLDATAIEDGNSGTVSVSENGRVFTVSGTAAYCCGRITVDVSKFAGNTIYYSGIINGNHVPAVTFYYINNEGTKTYISATTFRAGYTLPSDVKSIQVLFIANNTENILENVATATFENTMLSLNPEVEWEPYTGGKPGPNPDYPQDIVSIEKPTVNVYGKNLCPPSAFNVMNTNGSANTYDPSSNTITMDVDSTTSSGRYCAPCKNLIVGKPYTLSFDIRGTAGKKVTCGWNIGKLYVTLTNEYVRYSSTIIASHPSEAIIFYSYVASGGGLLSGEFIQFANVQIEYGETTTSYEPHMSIQSVAIQHTLPGIPVTSGGNYTDSDGQQWICDEVDLERGVHVQRINEVVYDGVGETWYKSSNNENVYLYHVSIKQEKAPGSGNCFCDRLNRKSTSEIQVEGNPLSAVGISPSPKYNVMYVNVGHFLAENTLDAFIEYLAEHPLTVNYILATPIETPLTAEEIIAFKALRTNYPNTTILNDAGAWMSVKYNADTKTYVENPKTLKLVDSSTGVVYELKIVDGNLTVTLV